MTHYSAVYNLQQPSKGDEENLEQYEEKCFKQLLDLIGLDLTNPTLNPSPTTTPGFSSRSTFVEDANRASQWIKQENNFPELLVFKSTPHETQPRHVNHVESKPDIVAAFEKDWQSGKDERKVPWPCIRLAGKDASKGKTKPGQMQQAVTYLDLLLLARPDFKAAFGLLISEKEFHLLVGIAGDRVYEFTFQWTSRFTRRVAYALVYFLYDFPKFQDSSIIMAHDKATGVCTYTFALEVKNKEDSEPRQVFCPRFVCRYARGSFGTRTHVFVSESLDPPKVAGQPVRVIKDQLCRKDTRFNEVGILKVIHRDGPVSGVIELVHEERILSSLVKDRETVRLGFKQEGDPFMSIKTPQEMLMVAYDALEGKFVVFSLSGKGNILCLKDYQKARSPSPVAIPPTQTDQGTAQTSSTVVLTDASLEARERKPSFIKFLLNKSYQALHPLIQQLGSYLVTDPYWFGKYSPDDPRTDPEYIHECFQRLILKFVNDNFNEPFMILPIDEKGRMVYQLSVTPSLTSPSVQATLSKRDWPSVATVTMPEEPDRKRRRLDPDASEQPLPGERGTLGEGESSVQE